jgi:hypothetical protein
MNNEDLTPDLDGQYISAIYVKDRWLFYFNRDIVR